MADAVYTTVVYGVNYSNSMTSGKSAMVKCHMKEEMDVGR
jgi:hypothetical protein